MKNATFLYKAVFSKDNVKTKEVLYIRWNDRHLIA